MNKLFILFTFSLMGIILVYLYVLGQSKTIEIIRNEYLFILAIIPLFLAFFYFKFKLKKYTIVDYNTNSGFSIKTTIIFFLVFQVIDYFMEDGFIGMISQWFLYWIMGLIAVLLMENINYYKNYKTIQNNTNKK